MVNELNITITTESGNGNGMPDRNAMASSGAIQNHLKDSIADMGRTLRTGGDALKDTLTIDAKVNGEGFEKNGVYNALQDVYSGKSSGTVEVTYDPEGSLMPSTWKQTLFSGPVTPENMEKVAVAARTAAEMLKQSSVSCSAENLSIDECKQKAVAAVQTALQEGLTR